MSGTTFHMKNGGTLGFDKIMDKEVIEDFLRAPNAVLSINGDFDITIVPRDSVNFVLVEK